VPKSMKLRSLVFFLGLGAVPFHAVFAAMPTAGLPFEPATSDNDLYNDPPADSQASDAPMSQGSLEVLERSKSNESGFGIGDDFGATLRLSLIKEGFGAQIKIVEYPRPWLALTQTFRYFKNDEEERLFNQRQGFLLGMDAQPWRKRFVSPFLNSQVGWEKFQRDLDRQSVDSPVVEASAGLELRLGRLASVVGQWTEAYYPGLEEPVFLPLRANGDPKRRAVAEVLFNLKWESRLQ